MFRILLATVFVAGVVPASAQILVGPANLTPANPNAFDTIRARFTVQVPGPCVDESSTVVDGTVIRTTTTFNCGVLQAFGIEVVQEFGPLPPNTYTYEIYFAVDGAPPALHSTQTFVVSPLPMPAISQLGLAILAMVLAVVAAARLA